MAGLVRNVSNHVQEKQHQIHQLMRTIMKNLNCHVPTPGPLYEELQPKSIPEQQHLVELKDNVAYGPIIVK